ncbi:MAG: 23S rRNA (pseudouridine(1915)-N(3))-methyltransferase RlmH [Lachnospiraceae bacterium]|nr:23S rRNA (pseudouridine(1915)-N(3))-methyltransferase RlmH [Lachnospiraceae bacterium]MBD5482898.1 23S rRNA (pseudouridine(1915)-N(3))-methyltransferase RlmH [Lachnospiraceae bacterium]
MNLSVVCVGKCKEAFFRDAVAEYAKRLSKYCDFRIIEVADEKTKEHASEREEQIVTQKEAERIEKALRPDDYVVALAIEGKKYDSVNFSRHIETWMGAGKSRIVFVIGGSLGLHERILSRADEKISFSDMTFPHQLMRVILAEQLYRAFRIMNGEPYHK